MKTTWQNTWKVLKTYPRLEENLATDVVIVGGGITGTTLAYLLSKTGKKVVVLEKGTLSEDSTTAYTTAFLTYQIDTNFPDLSRMFGAEDAKKVWQSGWEAIDEIENIIAEEKIDCEFMRIPEYIYANKEEEWEEVKNEGEAGIAAGFPIEVKPLGTELPFTNTGYIKIPKQAKFHPLKYTDALRRIAEEKYGAQFFENTEVKKIDGDKTAVAHTDRFTVSADWIVIATYAPFHNPHELFAKKGMYVSYIMELSVPKGFLEEGLYLDLQNPYHYMRLDSGVSADRLIIGGEDHRKEIKMKEEKNYNALLEYAKKILKGRSYDIITRWDGGILESIDGLPFIGVYSEKHPNRLVATAFSGNGMTYSMIASLIIKDIIDGKPNPYKALYSPERHYSLNKFFLKFRDYAEEFIHGALRNIWRKSKLDK